MDTLRCNVLLYYILSNSFLQNEARMSKYSVNEKSSCTTITVPADEVGSWTDLLKTRYDDHLQRIDGFTVQSKSDEGSKRSTFSIYDHKSNSKKPILTITIFSTGTIMAQGKAFQSWKSADLDILMDMK